MANEKVIIVGASHGGHQALLEMLHRYKDADVKLFEAGDFVSFMSCGMELYLENSVTDVNNVRNFSPNDFNKDDQQYVFNKHQVVKIDNDNKKVHVLDERTDKIEEYPYDKIILSSGVKPNTIPVPGNDLENVFLMRGYDWAKKIKSQLESPAVKNVTVIGAGYIGIEAAVVSADAGKKVTLIDRGNRPLHSYLDSEMTDLLEVEMRNHGVNIVTNDTVKEFQGKSSVESVKTNTGTYPSDLVILAAGVKPVTNWMDPIDLDDHGMIKTNEYLQTNLSDVYAIGDATLAYSIPAKQKMPIALASVARREARYVAKHIFEDTPSRPFGGVVGSSALSVFNYHFSRSGLSKENAEQANVPYKEDYYEDTLRPKYVPVNKGNPKVYVKLLYAPYDHKILGGAVLSAHDTTAQSNVISLAIQHGLTIEDLADADFFFQPGFDRQWNVLNLAAQHALGEPKFNNH